MQETRTWTVGILLACFLPSCTLGFLNTPEPEFPTAEIEDSTSAPPEDAPSRTEGDLGMCRRSPYDPQVKESQPILLYLGYYQGMIDGCKGPKTVAAVEKFQRDSGLPITGEIDEATEVALQDAKFRKGRVTKPPPIRKTPREKPESLQQKCSDKLRQMQGILRELGYYTGALDGCPGPKLTSAVRQFQQKTNLPATGTLDSATEAALLQ